MIRFQVVYFKTPGDLPGASGDDGGDADLPDGADKDDQSSALFRPVPFSLSR